MTPFRALFSKPGLRERFKIAGKSERRPIAPARPFPSRGNRIIKGNAPPLEGNDLDGLLPLRETRFVRRSPWIASLDVDRIVAHIGRVPQDNIKDGTSRRKGGHL